MAFEPPGAEVEARQKEEDQEPDERVEPRRPQGQQRHRRHAGYDEPSLPVAVDQEPNGQHGEEHTAPDRRRE
jgi:hypothetical protein